MTGWTDPDVTPVGGATPPPDGAPSRSADRAQAEAAFGRPAPSRARARRDDPFGSGSSRRRRGWIRIGLGVLLLVGGIGAAIFGIVQATTEYDRIDEDAVARGTVRDTARPDALRFVSPGPGRRDYTVYLRTGGLGLDSDDEDLTVRDTACVATMPDGVETRFRGARQDIAVTLGSAASVGHFSSQPGTVRVVCAYSSGSRGSRRVRPDAVPFVVTTGRPTLIGGGVLTIVGGVTVALLGGFVLAWGLRGSTRRR